tara:strand:+ start:1144 stop:1362 length:219 start_codon:yes stop_codon:yes gene_type:complete
MEATITHDGIEWQCFYEYDMPQEADDTDPAIPGIATIFQVYIEGKGVELYDHINPSTIHDLEALLEASHEDF